MVISVDGWTFVSDVIHDWSDGVRNELSATREELTTDRNDDRQSRDDNGEVWIDLVIDIS